MPDGEENCDGNDPGSSGNTQNLDVFLAHRKGNCLYPKFEFLGGFAVLNLEHGDSSLA